MSEVEKPERPRFFASGENVLTTLHKWLLLREYNDFYPFLLDRQGHRMVGLNWRTVDERGRETLDPRGLVVIRDAKLTDHIIKLIEEHMTEGQ